VPADVAVSQTVHATYNGEAVRGLGDSNVGGDEQDTKTLGGGRGVTISI
jgi:hypothetical protein